MGKITILEETTKNPISLIGKRAGICWGSDISDEKKNYDRGMKCIESNHGRTLEFVNVESVIEGYSARVIREWYTHIGGSPTRLQASTRYINYDNFDYIIPPTVKTEQQKKAYIKLMNDISDGIKCLTESGVPKEDTALVLPLGMTTKIVDKRNLRNIIDMSKQRMCMRAYWEYREMFNEYITQLKNLSEEWAIIISTQMKPKCFFLGYCPESNGCGLTPKR